LSRAKYFAEWRYLAVDPENRQVGRTLEQHWEAALAKQRQAQEDYDRFQHERPLPLAAPDRQRIEALAHDIPALWHAPRTTIAGGKEIVRCLVTRVVVHVKKDSEYVDATIHWQGGFTSQMRASAVLRAFCQAAISRAIRSRSSMRRPRH
jgi:hypothetical protein